MRTRRLRGTSIGRGSALAKTQRRRRTHDCTAQGMSCQLPSLVLHVCLAELDLEIKLIRRIKWAASQLEERCEKEQRGATRSKLDLETLTAEERGTNTQPNPHLIVEAELTRLQEVVEEAEHKLGRVRGLTNEINRWLDHLEHSRTKLVFLDLSLFRPNRRTIGRATHSCSLYM